MSEENSNNNSSEHKPAKLTEGYNPLKKGYTPTQGSLDSKNPPKGGSGVSQGNSSNGSPAEKKS